MLCMEGRCSIPFCCAPSLPSPTPPASRAPRNSSASASRPPASRRASSRRPRPRYTRPATRGRASAMLGFARATLAAHDEAAAYFVGSAMRGRLRFGAADDLALTHLPQVLRDFRQLYPQINLELTVGQSGYIARRLAAGQLDLV